MIGISETSTSCRVVAHESFSLMFGGGKASHTALRRMTTPVGILVQHHHPATLALSEGAGNRRSACDRCRSHKLRCDRDRDASQCRRCLKADAECVTGAALKSGRPLNANNTSTHQVSIEQQHPHEDHDRLHMMQPQDFPTFPTPPHAGFDIPDGGIPSTIDGDIDMQTLVSPSNLMGFDDMWADGLPPEAISASLDQPAAPDTSNNQSSNASTFCAPLGPHFECFTRLGELQKSVLADLQIAKLCRTAETCTEARNPPPADSNNPGHSFLVGRMFDHSKALLAIMSTFEPVSMWDVHPSNGVQQANMQSHQPPGLRCDVPILVSLLSTYVCLVRIYRIILSCILGPMPVLLGLPPPVPQLFPGINLAGFSLEGRLDLQIQILIQVSEDMIAKIEAKLGVTAEETCDQVASVAIFPPKKTVKMFRMMMDEEADEQPQLNDPRGPCGTLRDVLADLKKIIQAENGKHTR